MRREFCCCETIEKINAVNVLVLVIKANVDVAEVREGPCILYGIIKPCMGWVGGGRAGVLLLLLWRQLPTGYGWGRRKGDDATAAAATGRGYYSRELEVERIMIAASGRGSSVWCAVVWVVDGAWVVAPGRFFDIAVASPHHPRSLF